MPDEKPLHVVCLNPNNAWARLQDVQDMMNSAMISPQDGRRLLGHMDLGDAIPQSEWDKYMHDRFGYDKPAD